MHYVIQVAPGTEVKTEAQISEIISPELYSACFHPTRIRRKKFHGQWKDVKEKLLPGYVFIVSEDIRNLAAELRRVPALTRLLGVDPSDNGCFIPLSDRDVNWLERLMNPSGAPSDTHSYEAGLSRVTVTENDEVVILSGPLENMKGMIKKINLHKRVAEVEVDFMNRRTVIYLGIDLVARPEDIA